MILTLIHRLVALLSINKIAMLLYRSLLLWTSKKIALNIIPAKVFGHLIWKTMALFVIRCQLIDNVLANITYIQNIRTD